MSGARVKVDAFGWVEIERKFVGLTMFEAVHPGQCSHVASSYEVLERNDESGLPQFRSSKDRTTLYETAMTGEQLLAFRCALPAFRLLAESLAPKNRRARRSPATRAGKGSKTR